jgi:hypothetical protein
MIKRKLSKKIQKPLTDLVRMQINEKTWVYVSPDLTEKEIEDIKNRYRSKLNN